MKVETEIVEESGVSKNIFSNRIDKLVKMEILEIDTTYEKKAYKYKEIYNVFIEKDIFKYLISISIII